MNESAGPALWVIPGEVTVHGRQKRCLRQKAITAPAIGNGSLPAADQ